MDPSGVSIIVGEEGTWRRCSLVSGLPGLGVRCSWKLFPGLPESRFITEPNDLLDPEHGQRHPLCSQRASLVLTGHSPPCAQGGFSSVHTGMLPISEGTSIFLVHVEVCIGVRARGDSRGLVQHCPHGVT